MDVVTNNENKLNWRLVTFMTMGKNIYTLWSLPSVLLLVTCYCAKFEN